MELTKGVIGRRTERISLGIDYDTRMTRVPGPGMITTWELFGSQAVPGFALENLAITNPKVADGTLGSSKLAFDPSTNPHGDGQHSIVYARQADMPGKAANPHGNSQHTVEYASNPHASGQHTGIIGSKGQIENFQHGNDDHHANYVTANHGHSQYAGDQHGHDYAARPHGNSHHSTNYASVDHNHSQSIKLMGVKKRRAAVKLREELRKRRGEDPLVDAVLVLMGLTFDEPDMLLEDTLGRDKKQQRAWNRRRMMGPADGGEDIAEVESYKHPDLDAILK